MLSRRRCKRYTCGCGPRQPRPTRKRGMRARASFVAWERHVDAFSARFGCALATSILLPPDCYLPALCASTALDFFTQNHTRGVKRIILLSLFTSTWRSDRLTIPSSLHRRFVFIQLAMSGESNAASIEPSFISLLF